MQKEMLCGKPTIRLRAGQLLASVCVKGGAPCPLLAREEAATLLNILAHDPAATIRLECYADGVPHYTTIMGANRGEHVEASAARLAADAPERKRDLDVLQRLGLSPGDTRRARYLYELLFERIATPEGICARLSTQDAPGWRGCPEAKGGAFERVRRQGWASIVYARGAEEMAAFRRRNIEAIQSAERLFIRPHHIMCLACGYAGGEHDEPRPNDTLWEILERIRRDPEVPITLVEGPCMACDCCDGFHPESGRCVHAGGLIRDYKKDLDCFERLGVMPGATLPARQLFALVFERIPSTRDICAYGNGIVTAREWAICGDPEGNASYTATRERFLAKNAPGSSTFPL